MNIQKIWLAIKHEFTVMLPIYLYFLTAAAILYLTESLVLDKYGIHFFDIARAFVVAIIITKAIIIADSLKFSKKFANRPLIYSTLWLTAIYLFCGFLIKYLEHLILHLFKHESFFTANLQIWQTINWPTFCLLTLWATILLYFFAAQREVIHYIGAKKFRKLFFG